MISPRNLHAHLRLLAWVALFAIMLVGHYDRYYLASWNIYLLAGTTAALVVLFVAGLRYGSSPAAGQGVQPLALGAWIETGCHFAPLLLFAIVGPSMPGLTAMRSAAFMPYAHRHESHAAAAGNVPPSGYLSVTILDLHTAPERYENEPIEVLGRIHVLTAEDLQALPPGAKGKSIRVILYRYVITCCVADATPISAVLQDVDPAVFHDDEWYKIRGKSHYVAGGVDVPFIQVAAFEPIKEPVNPYLSAVDEMFR